MDSAIPVPLVPIRQRAPSLSPSFDGNHLEPSCFVPDERVNADEGQGRLLSPSEQNATGRDSGPLKPLSRSRNLLRVQSGPPVVIKNELRHAFPGLISCAISWILIASFYAFVWLYKDQVMSPYRKAHFDGVIVGWGIVFGLNITSGLKGIALDLRWWVLNGRKRSDHEVNLILHCDSLTQIARLIFVSREMGIKCICVCWLFLIILVQTGIASMSLTMPGDPGPADIYRETGQSDMAVPNLAAFAPNPGRFDHRYLTECLAAHILGEVGSNYKYTTSPKEGISETPWARHPASFLYATDHWQYVFCDSAILDGPLNKANTPLKAVAIYTDQVVNASGICRTPIFWANRTDQLHIININSTGEAIYFPLLPPESVFYLTTPILSTPKAGCGPGCGNVKVLEEQAGPPVPGSPVSDRNLFYYDCNITVSATKYLSPENAAVAAQAIALSGEIHPEIFKFGPGDNQWRSYTRGVPFGEPQNNSAIEMASLISRFAIGVIAAAAETNPKAIIKGRAPAQGVRIKLEKPVLFHFILILTGLVQSCLLGVAIKFGSKLEIPLIATSHQAEIQKLFVDPLAP